jgi:hypothetical protein
MYACRIALARLYPRENIKFSSIITFELGTKTNLYRRPVSILPG